MREQILSGILELPFANRFEDRFGEEIANVTERMFRSAWSAYMRNKGSINGVYWSEQFNDPSTFNVVLMSLSNSGWLVTHAIPSRNWSELEINEDKLLQYVSEQELTEVRASKKFLHYLPVFQESYISNLTKVNGKKLDTGLVRSGFAKAGNSQFFYDSNLLKKYSKAITLNVTKGMDKVKELYPEFRSDKATYDTVSASIVDFISNNPQMYSTGTNYSDSRGRAISSCLSKVANPIGYKDFRALLTIPSHLRVQSTQDGVDSIYLFIAELMGFKNGTLLQKKLFGEQCYNNRSLYELDLGLEDDRKELHENIWLERLYDDLDKYFSNVTFIAIASELGEPLPGPHKWSVPIELDASASLIQYCAVLLNDKRLANMTNLIGDELVDPWDFDGIPRKQFKTAATPLLYGSSKSCHELWQNNKMPYTLEQVQIFNKQLNSGALGLINDFKDFVIKNCKPEEVMEVSIDDSKFTIQCNRFRNVGEKTTLYDIFDSVTNVIKRVAHTKTKRVADLDQFRRYFQTLLVHHLDSVVADSVIDKVMDKYGWGIPIHDAFIVSPEAATDTRTWYASELEGLHTKRKSILANYFASIGIGSECQNEWDKLQSKVDPLDEPFECSLMALK